MYLVYNEYRIVETQFQLLPREKQVDVVSFGVQCSTCEAFLTFCKLVMCMAPTSSSAERTFSQLNLIKCSLRNQLSDQTVNSLLLVKMFPEETTLVEEVKYSLCYDEELF